MKRAILLLLASAVPLFAQNEAVTIKAKDKTIVNPLVIFPSGKTLECDDCTLIGFGAAVDLNFINSLSKSGANVSLVNDSATPGNSKYYGTDSGGTKGFFTLPSGGTWGSITGTLSDQTDLQSALDAKAPANAHYVTTQSESGLSNEFDLGSLGAGILAQTVSGGIATPVIAIEGVNYLGGSRIKNLPFGALYWSGATAAAPSMDSVYTWGHTFDSDDDGKVNVLDMGAGIVKTDAGGVVSAATGGTDYTDNAFKTISVSGQSDIVADSAADTLTLAAGTGITLTTDAGTDTVTVAASGASGGGWNFVNAENASTAVNDTNYVTIISQSLSSIAANDTIIVDVWATLLNNSGTNRTYSFQLNVGSVAVFDFANVQVGTVSATSHNMMSFRYVVSVSATNVWRALVIEDWLQAQAANTIASGTIDQLAWNSGTDNLTGTQTVSFKVKSSNATATQTFKLHSYGIRRVAKNP